MAMEHFDEKIVPTFKLSSPGSCTSSPKFASPAVYLGGLPAILTSSSLTPRYTNYMKSVINDPLGQTHSHASSEHCFCCFVFLDLKSGDWRTNVRMDVRTTCVKTMIPTGRDFGLAEWIKKDWKYSNVAKLLLTFQFPWLKMIRLCLEISWNTTKCHQMSIVFLTVSMRKCLTQLNLVLLNKESHELWLMIFF